MLAITVAAATAIGAVTTAGGLTLASLAAVCVGVCVGVCAGVCAGVSAAMTSVAVIGGAGSAGGGVAVATSVGGGSDA